MSLWVKNTDGKSSASLTLVMVAFTVIMLWMTLSIFVNPFGIQTVPFNASEAMIVLTPLLATYFGRRYTDNSKENKNNIE
jgi:hypothetical protein